MSEYYRWQGVQRQFHARFGGGRYSTRVAHTYEGDLERAAGDSDEHVAATVAAWEKAHGMPVLDWSLEHYYDTRPDPEDEPF